MWTASLWSADNANEKKTSVLQDLADHEFFFHTAKSILKPLNNQSSWAYISSKSNNSFDTLVF